MGVWGIILNRGNLILTLMSIELMFLSIMLLLVPSSKLTDDANGLVFILLILTVAAAESALGLAIFVMYHRKRGSISVGVLNLLRG